MKKDTIETNTEKFPEEEKDLQERINGFVKELGELLGKYELGVTAMAEITREGTISAKPVIVSSRKLAKKEEKQEAEFKPINPKI
jgi:hypothetical protein